MRFLLGGLLIILACLGQAQGLPVGDRAGFGGAQEGPQFLPVDEAYQLEIEVLEQGDLRLYWQIAETYYLYQHRFKFALEDHSGQAVELDIELGMFLPVARGRLWRRGTGPRCCGRRRFL